MYGRPGASRLLKVWLFYVLIGVLGAGAVVALAPSSRAAGRTAADSTLAVATVSESTVAKAPAETLAAAASEPPAASEPAAAAPAPVDDARGRVKALRAKDAPSSLAGRAVSFLGLFAMVGICWLMSDNRRKVDWKLVAWGLALQLAFGILVLKTAPGLWVFEKLNTGTLAVIGFAGQGTNFLFSSYITGKIESSLVNFALNVLPTIIFFSSLMTLGYYLGIMQVVVNFFAGIMQKTMKCSGAETLSTAANIFVGQTEAPLVVKPYVKDMTNSELLCIMVGGFANTAGSVLAAYVGMLHSYFPDIAGHLIAQSVMSAPAALVCAKIVMPETGKPVTGGAGVKMPKENIDANALDAAARGASEGLALAVNVAAMLLAFIALIALGNAILTKLSTMVGGPPLTIERILGFVGAPIAWLMGVPLHDCWTVGKLIGVKTGVNEFVAYLQLADILKAGDGLSYRSVIIASYALSGFSNFSSIAIQIGGISGIAPTRRHDLAKLGLKAMIVGSIATFMTATVAGVLIS
jgi:concentrative nucleoside transporter, CNT family